MNIEQNSFAFVWIQILWKLVHVLVFVVIKQARIFQVILCGDGIIGIKYYFEKLEGSMWTFDLYPFIGTVENQFHVIF